MWHWPLPGHKIDVPTSGPGAFGAVRRYDVHTGVDLYCCPGQPVCAVEPGTVVAVVPFTGGAESPWWNDTRAVMVLGPSGVVLYGELDPSVTIGAAVGTGDRLGTVLQVLKQDKELPTTMLHLELYCPLAREPVWWLKGYPQPESLRDPTEFLVGIG